MKKIFIYTTALTFISQAAYAVTCNKRITFKTNSVVKTPVYRCTDGTVSYAQPKTVFMPYATNAIYRFITRSKKSLGRTESFCGATAASNVHNAYCRFFINPRSIADKYFNDINPGVRYDTMLYGLIDFFANQGRDCVGGYWRLTHPKTGADFLKSIRSHLYSGKKSYWKDPKTGNSISPVIVLLNRTPKTASMHFVTVVGIEGYNPKKPSTRYNSSCIVHINEWGRRTTETCSKFIKNSKQVNAPMITRWMHDFYLFRYR